MKENEKFKKISIHLISIHQVVVKVSFLSEKSAHDGRFLLYFSLIAILHNFNNKNSFVRKSCW